MYSQLPPLNSIKVFDAAARLKSFKKAAEELHVTPTAVSHQIKALEEALGTLLFERKTRAVQLTRDGELLAETAYSVLQQLTNVINEISNAKNIITISTTSSFAAMWLVPNLEEFYKLHPGIEVAVKTGEQVDDIEKDRRIDLAIRYGVHNDSKKNSTKLVTEKIGMYATPNYIESINSIADAHLLETRWHNDKLPSISWKTFVSGKLGATETLKVRQFDQEHHVIQAALAGQGIALVSSLLVENAIAQQWLVDYKTAAVNHTTKGMSYYLLVPEHNIRSKSILAFKNWVIKKFELYSESLPQ
ncbi:LysR family transcriptional regulator [Photobacterium sp. OFAV2-7]|uniref:LysR family transcriptional regulator n=1 Tax=Photobacterium sp. OFAV2-7 TaxID=2917748 RepID=UPI001EF6D678|nr:LysR family transcriptional regulator [Photobacterium sp. OFAV2-7]MCG7585417.1 LysR substrate-binding domain-containing protein [Photobacterium sp. OFAV2-7]